MRFPSLREMNVLQAFLDVKNGYGDLLGTFAAHAEGLTELAISWNQLRLDDYAKIRTPQLAALTKLTIQGAGVGRWGWLESVVWYLAELHAGARGALSA